MVVDANLAKVIHVTHVPVVSHPNLIDLDLVRMDFEGAVADMGFADDEAIHETVAAAAVAEACRANAVGIDDAESTAGASVDLVDGVLDEAGSNQDAEAHAASSPHTADHHNT